MIADQASRYAVIAAAVVIALSVAVVAWSHTTRSTALVGAGVYRENLITGEDQFCGVAPDGAGCIVVRDAPKA